MSENQLLLAAALAGVATVHLGGAGAGPYLQQGAEATVGALASESGATDMAMTLPEAATTDAWRKILLRTLPDLDDAAAS